MTKLNNKGVSLIDCLIAIAVLALLVSPIIAQLFTTIQVSAEAKEKQYVIDDATEVYEYFRKYDNKELKTDRANEIGFELEPNTALNPNPETGKKVLTELRLKDGSSVTGVSIEYEYTKYKLKPSGKLGREQNQYKRTVVRTNLRNKLYEKGYQIDYSVTNGSTLPTQLTSYTFRSDNALVKYESTTDANQYDDSKITAIVVKKVDDITDTYISKLKDPNEVDIGNVQDIDAEKMAIISGDATAIDYQLDLSLQNVLVQYATANPSSAIGTYADDPAKLNNYIKSVINNASSTSKVRKIKLYVTAGRDTNGVPIIEASTGKPKYYTVKCDVTYKVTFSGDDLKAFNNFTSTTGEFTYPVLERNYYTTTPPDIYMIYEPLLLSTSLNNYVFYADSDYISIYTDEYTSGVEDPDNTPDFNQDDVTRCGDDPSRLYLVRSDQNWAKATHPSGEKLPSATTVRHFDDHAYYTYIYGKFVPVNIVINMEKHTSNDLKPIDIYTNISKASLHTPDATDLGQFSVEAADSSAPSVGTGFTRYAYDADRIIRSDEEFGVEKLDRLGQITVTYQKLDGANPVGEVTYITGAKGAD